MTRSKPTVATMKEALKSFIRAVNDLELDGDVRNDNEAEKLETLHDGGIALLAQVRALEASRKAQAGAGEDGG